MAETVEYPIVTAESLPFVIRFGLTSGVDLAIALKIREGFGLKGVCQEIGNGTKCKDIPDAQHACIEEYLRRVARKKVIDSKTTTELYNAPTLLSDALARCLETPQGGGLAKTLLVGGAIGLAAVFLLRTK